jgi:hypothetical protein
MLRSSLKVDCWSCPQRCNYGIGWVIINANALVRASGGRTQLPHSLPRVCSLPSAPFTKKYSLNCASSPPRHSPAPRIRTPRPPRPHCPLTVAASTEPGSLYDECSNKHARGASCDTAPLASCPRRCHISELHALLSTFAMTSLHSSEQ